MMRVPRPGGEPSEAGSHSRRRLLAETSRVEAFSDGVLAIALTLLVLDLRAPTRRGLMLHDLLIQWPVYVAYLASFAYVGVIWVNHHQLFTRITRVDSGLLWRNLILLLATSVLPFPTAVVGSAFQAGDRGDQRVAVIFYSIVGAAAAAAWLLLFHFLSGNPGLLRNEAHAGFFATERRRAALGIASYAAAAVVAAWQPLAALIILCALPVFYGLTSEGWHIARP